MGSRKNIKEVASGTLSVQVQKTAIQWPCLYRVMLFNDDYTPMAFVVTVLQKFFGLCEEKAVQVMLEVHNKGKAICGVYTRDIAETKVYQVNDFAREASHPLLCLMEPE